MESQRKKGMTDECILRRICSGSLQVSSTGDEVVSYSIHGERKLQIVERTSRSSTYRFVDISYGGGKKKIALHRLVWMSVNRKVIPEGMDVHHKDADADYIDGIDNLALVPSGVNRSCREDLIDEFT